MENIPIGKTIIYYLFNYYLRNEILMNKEEKILESWKLNATNWIEVIESNAIESRKLATNNAIVNAVVNAQPVSVLDIGCGEGWLAKELSDRGSSVTGIDAIPALLERAREKSSGRFITASYQEIAEGDLLGDNRFDVVVINFALISKESTEHLLGAIPALLNVGGKLFIQTLHPYNRKALDDYKTGWKTGSWDGLGDRFIEPYEWYFRTIEDWYLLLGKTGFTKLKATDVHHPQTGALLSVIFECSL